MDGGGPRGHRRPGVHLHLLQGMHSLEGDTHVGAQGQPSNGQKCKTVYTDVDSWWALITLHQRTSGFIEALAWWFIFGGHVNKGTLMVMDRWRELS